MGNPEKTSPLKKLGFLLAILFAAVVFPGCTMRIDTVLQPTTAAPHQIITVRLNTEAESGGGGGARTGELAVLLPNDWSVVSSSYYTPPFHLTDTLTAFEATSTVPEPTAAPDGYQWYIVQTPVTEEPSTGDKYTIVINMEAGATLGTYNLKYYVGDTTWSWTSNLSQDITIGPDPCADVAAPADTNGNGYREIHNACQLQMMQDHLSADYELTKNIDFHASENLSFLTGNSFVPVGTISSPFSGHFNGHQYTIAGLFIYEPEQTGVGLFGYVTGQVTNLRLTDSQITGGNRVGSVAGRLTSATAALENIAVFGHATGTDMVGGIVGDLFQSTVSSSYSEVTIFSNGDESTGGIAGSMELARLANVYSVSHINSSAQYVGGLVGHDSASAPSSIINSYSAGEVSGNDYIGGLVGYNNHDDIRSSFSVVSPLSSRGNPNVGGFVGGENLHLSEFLYSDNYWLRGLEAGIGNDSELVSSTKWEPVDSADIFKGTSTAPPFKIGDTQVWDTNVWLFTAGAYPQLAVFSPFTLTYDAGGGGSIEGSATQTVWSHADGTAVFAVPNTNYRFLRWSDGSTSNPRVDTNVTTNQTYTALFQSLSGGGGVAWTMPVASGNGTRTITDPRAPIGSVLYVGPILSTGVNVLTYITNQNQFALEGSHDKGESRSYQFVISELDLNDPRATLEFQPGQIFVKLRKGETQTVDIDGDQVADLIVTFSDLSINRVEITLARADASILSLQKQAEQPPVSPPIVTSSKILFTRSLRYGMSGQDVLQLQRVLNAHGFLLAAAGLGSPGKETSFFGQATKQALMAFQRKYGLAPYSGFANAKTIKRLNSL